MWPLGFFGRPGSEIVELSLILFSLEPSVDGSARKSGKSCLETFSGLIVEVDVVVAGFGESVCRLVGMAGFCFQFAE